MWGDEGGKEVGTSPVTSSNLCTWQIAASTAAVRSEVTKTVSVKQRGTTQQQATAPAMTVQLWTPSRILISFQCCFTSTQTIRLIRHGESRTATSTVSRRAHEV